MIGHRGEAYRVAVGHCFFVVPKKAQTKTGGVVLVDGLLLIFKENRSFVLF